MDTDNKTTARGNEMFYINLKNGKQHTAPLNVGTKIGANQYANEIFGKYQVSEIVNSITGESFSPWIHINYPAKK